MIENLSKFSVSYNKIKGVLLTQIGNLIKLNLLHLHSNRLEGNADYFNYLIPNFTTDCGRTLDSPPLVTCQSCTQYCNNEENCVNVDETRIFDLSHVQV